MWLKMMRRWLLGVAVTLAATPGDAALREARTSASDALAKCEAEAGNRGFDSNDTRNGEWGRGEPLLSDILSDPVCHALMGRDGVSRQAILALADRVATERRERS